MKCEYKALTEGGLNFKGVCWLIIITRAVGIFNALFKCSNITYTCSHNSRKVHKMTQYIFIMFISCMNVNHDYFFTAIKTS